MYALYLVSVWLHIVAAALWVGGLIFFALVVVPALRRQDQAGGAALLHRLGVRYRVVGWGSLVLLAVTGVLNLTTRGIRWSDLASSQWWQTPFGRLLAWKLALVAAVVVVGLLHDVAAGTRATARMQAQPGSPETLRLRRRALLLGRLMTLLSLAIVALAVLLVRGVPR